MTIAVPLTDLTEKEWQAQVVQLARMFGWKHFHPYDSRRSAHGYPDLTLVRDRVVFLELKAERGKPTAAQKEWLRAMLDAGCEAYIARPADAHLVATILSRRTNTGDAALTLAAKTRAEVAL